MPFRLDLPDDVNYEGFRCVRVWIPDTSGYESALHSLLTYAGNWFGWESDSAKRGKQAAQAWRNAFQLTITDYLLGRKCTTCEDNDCPDCPGCPGCAGRLDGLSEEILMGLCGYNPKAFKIENGSLWVKDFCGEWVEIGALEGPDETAPETNPVETDPWSECGKAMSIITVLTAIVQAAIDNKNDEFSFEAAVRAAAPGVTLGRADIYALLALVLALDGFVSDEAATDADMVQTMVCKALPGMLETGTGSEAELLFIYASVKSAIWEYQGVTDREALWLVWEKALNAIGSNDRIWLLALGASDATADCTCPAIDPYTGDVIFQDERTIHLESQGSALTVADLITPHQMYFEVYGGNNDNFQEVHWDERLIAPNPIQELQLEFPLVSADVTDYYPAKSWLDDNPTPLVEYMLVPLIGGDAADTVEYFTMYHKQIVIFKWVAPADIDFASIDFGVKLNPKAQTGNRQLWKFRAEITYSGPLR